MLGLYHDQFEVHSFNRIWSYQHLTPKNLRVHMTLATNHQLQLHHQIIIINNGSIDDNDEADNVTESAHTSVDDGCLVAGTDRQYFENP